MTGPSDRSPEDVFEAFVNGRLSKGEWTHEAHLITCWIALRHRSPAETLAFLRDAIQTHNCGIGIQNTEIGGYHETLTVYYVAAVHGAAASTLDELFVHPDCARDATLRFWSREALFSTEARLGWLAPDITFPEFLDGLEAHAQTAAPKLL